MGFYEQNVKNMKQYKVQVYEDFIKYDSSLAQMEPEEVFSVDTKDKIQALIIKKEDKEYRMNSIFHPIKEAERWVKQYSFFHLNNVIIMYGLGNGLFAEHIMKNMNENDRLIIYEPSANVFFHVLEHYNLQELIANNNVILAINDINKHAYHVFLQMHINITNIKTRIVCIHPNYDKIFPEEAISFWNELKDNYIHTKGNINTEAFFGKIIIENTLVNSKYFKNSLGLIQLGKVLPRDLPVILVAAGPSVGENIEELKKAKGSAIIIAVDRVLDFLLDNGIEPDMIATLDPIKPLEQFSKRENITIPLLCILESSVDILNSHKGKKIICNVSKFTSKLYLDNNKVPPTIYTGSSVATMIFATVIYMGFRKIILIGQDLAYRGNITHVGQVEEISSQDMFVDGMDGTKIKSRVDWHEFIVWYQDLIKFYPLIQVYDTKSSGAKIEGAIVKPLKEIMKDYSNKNYNIREMIENVKPEFSQNEVIRIQQYWIECMKDLDDVKRKAHEGIEACEKITKEWEKNKCTSSAAKIYLKDINKITEFISERNIYNLLEGYITAYATEALSNIYTFLENEEENVINTYNRSKHVFEGIEKACEFAMPILKQCSDRENH